MYGSYTGLGKMYNFQLYTSTKSLPPPPPLSQFGWKAGYEYGLACDAHNWDRTVRQVNDLSCEHRRPNHTKFECMKFQNWFIKTFHYYYQRFWSSNFPMRLIFLENYVCCLVICNLGVCLRCKRLESDWQKKCNKGYVL